MVKALIDYELRGSKDDKKTIIIVSILIGLYLGISTLIKFVVGCLVAHSKQMSFYNLGKLLSDVIGTEK